MSKRELCIEGGANDITYSNKNGKSILSDLQKYNLDDIIVNRANIIYNKMELPTRRAKNRTCLLFFCVYNAYKELGINVNPTELGLKFGLNHGQIQKTNSLFSFLKTGYKPVPKAVTPLDFLADYCEKLNLSEYIENILNFSKNILDNNEHLLELVPQTVAAGLITYYLEINGINLPDNVNLSDIIFRSDTTIDSMRKKIAELDI